MKNVGFFYIKNTNIDENLCQNLLQYSKRFFALPEQVKKEIHVEKSGTACRGYVPLREEQTSGKPDNKELIYCGNENDEKNESVIQNWPMHGKNQWLDEQKYNLQGFKQTFHIYFEQMKQLAHHIMEIISIALNLPQDFFRKRFSTDPFTQFFFLRYPPNIWKEDQNQWGVGEHTDYGFLTILLLDGNEGLQVKKISGDWINVSSIKGTFVVNIGDMLELWTHGLYRATPHRVKNQKEKDRYSIPFFFDPNFSATLEPIDLSEEIQQQIKQRKDSAIDRWDKVEISQLSQQMTYGQFNWNKNKKLFPHLIDY